MKLSELNCGKEYSLLENIGIGLSRAVSILGRTWFRIINLIFLSLIGTRWLKCAWKWMNKGDGQRGLFILSLVIIGIFAVLIFIFKGDWDGTVTFVWGIEAIE